MSEPAPVDLADTAAELAGHVRTDWLADDRLHPRHLRFAHRDTGAFTADGVRLTGRLADLTAGGWRYAHHGEPGPLLDALAAAR